jgi:hypothetical protein
MTMTDLSNKPISYTGSHPLELAYRALLARAEAAEAEAADAILAASDAAQREENAMHALSHFRARVAELEAQLAWRPGSENPPAPDWYQVGDIGVGVYDLWYSGEAWHRSSFQGATYRTPPMSTPDFWRFIPPLPPAPQEPTP